MRQIVTLICDECNRRDYTTSREKKNSRLNLRKYCRFCRKHTLHKEK